MPLNPYVESFVRKIHFHHHRLFHGPKRKVLTYQRCVKSFIVFRGTGFARGTINLATLDILELQGRLYGSDEAVNRKMIDRKISTLNQRNEFRSFFFFLQKEFPGNCRHLPFIKSERPDFIIRLKNQLIGIEVTEAIDAGNAKLRARVYKSRLRGRDAGDIEQYANQSPKIYKGKPGVPLKNLIIKRIRDKQVKFQEFQSVDREILLIIANHPGFQRPRDIEAIRRALEANGSWEEAPFTLGVVNMIHGVYAHYQWVDGKVEVKTGEEKIR
jgi:hypothetical protein